ncbi:Hsp20/alpha crystallin family protein [Streptomyces alkaliphilus]|uniref:Hsp20 family protein n=1 Tax=Streptomyces alkaliphilus TaxID=1472722 RepID=A0A7W3TER9_9ACTN|nr:Hsp20/alpha crystallin family protein [Streptomyces alkaliphilus]MBB0245330.1 Hsp20 family protein [Streptomyces alkaliphilus]MQS08189.1 Hsp20 family protein [Streptomyces alkaliphilus]
MLMRTDPLREFDKLAQQLLGTATRPAAMPLDAYRTGDTFTVEFDLPGVTPESIDIDIERNVLTVTAERAPSLPEGAESVLAERSRGTFSRQLFLGDSLDTDRIEARYDTGVLTLRIPVAERAKPRKVMVSGGSEEPREIKG